MENKRSLLGHISSLSVDKYRIIYLIMVMITIFGFGIYNRLPRESKPEIVFPTIKVSVNYPGASPQDVEQLITDRLEASLTGLPDLEFISSKSLAGRSEIQLDFYPESDLSENNDTVNRILTSVARDLPDEAEIPSVRVSTTANRAFLVVSLSGDLDPVSFREVASIVERRLTAVEGVSEVRISGLVKREIQIIYSSAKLAEFKLQPDDILQAIRLRHKDTPAGEVILDDMLHYVRVLGAFGSMDEIGQTVVPLPAGGTRLLKDLARIELHSAPVNSFSRQAVDLGTSEARMLSAVTVSLYRDGGSDIVGPSEDARRILNELEEGDILSGVNIQVIQDDAETVKQDLMDVLGNALSGLLIVVLVLYLFLGIREALVTSLIIPFSMFISFIALETAGMTFNTMTMLAMIIALGLLVDNGIVVVESVVEYRNKGLNRAAAVKAGASEMAPSIFAATLTTMAAFIPLALMEGRIGMIISVIPVTVIFIISASLLLSLTLTPAMCSRWLKKDISSDNQSFSWAREIFTAVLVSVLFGAAFLIDNRPGLLSFIMAGAMGLFMVLRVGMRYRNWNTFESVTRNYKRFLSFLLSRPFLRVLLPMVMFALMGVVFWGISSGFLKIELFPIKDETALYAVITAPEYSTLENTGKITARAEELLLDIDGVSTMYSEIGLTSSRDAQVVMNLLPPGERTWSTQEKIPELMALLSRIPGAKISVGTQAGGKTANSPVQILVQGEDFTSINEAVETISSVLSGVPGVRGVLSDWERGYPEIQILPRQFQTSELGLNSTILGTQVRSSLNGQVAGAIVESGDEEDIVLMTDPQMISSVEDLESILLSLKGGAVPITYAADLVSTQGYGTIRHYQGVRTVTVMAQMLPDANIREIVDSFEASLGGVSALPPGTSYTWGGEAADLDSSFNEMTINFLIALLVVFLILALQFNSLSQALVILLTVPMAVIGVFTGLVLTGNNFGLYAFMGVIALVGIVVNDAIVLVDTVNRYRKDGSGLTEALSQSGGSRFGPVLATSLTTIGGMLPLAFKDANFAQLSISLISGLIASTILTLLILPLIFFLMEKLIKIIQKRIPLFIDEEEVVK